MTDKLLFQGVLKAVSSANNSLRKELLFIFTDFEPNVNKQGIPKTEAENIMSSAVNMPIKINFDTRTRRETRHAESYPIGTITNTYLENDKILAQAVVWVDEFPEIVNHLVKSIDEERPVQFSWELYPKKRTKDENGITWLEECTVTAATIVANPAYGGRTPLLAIAEENMDELRDKLCAVYTKLCTDLGSEIAANINDITIEELVEQFNYITVSTDTVISHAEDFSKIEKLEAELNELRLFKENFEKAEAERKIQEDRKIQLTNRLAVLDEAGVVFSGDSATENTIIDMDDPTFNLYVTTLKSIIANKIVAEQPNGRNRVVIPDPIITENSDEGMSARAVGLAWASALHRR